MRSEPRLKALLGGVALAIGVLVMPATASATPIGLTAVNPDITVTDLDLTYLGGVLNAVGTVSSFGTYSPGPENIDNLAYSLTASIDSSGVLSGGSFWISGAVPSLGLPPGMLLAGTLTAPLFGSSFQDFSTTFEFLFDTTASASSLGFGPSGGIIMNFANPAQLSFGADFSGTATADTFAAGVPEPGSLLLLAMGVLGARRRFARRA